MSRKHDRAQARAQKLTACMAETRQKYKQTRFAGPGQRTAVQEFIDHLYRIDATGLRVWAVVTPIQAELTDLQEREELGAIAAQVVNPRLAGRRTPGSVDERRARGTPPGRRKPPRSTDRPEEGQDHP